MGRGFIGIILSWMLSERRVWWARMGYGMEKDRYGSWNRSIWLGEIITSIDAR